MIKRLRLVWCWLRSRFAPQNAFVRCSTCPNWIKHSVQVSSLGTRYGVGICARKRPHVFNDFTTGFAFKAWTGHDWCPDHPLYEANIVQGSDLQYRPGEDATHGRAGFDRLPTFREAVAMALKNPDAGAIEGESSASTEKH